MKFIVDKCTKTNISFLESINKLAIENAIRDRNLCNLLNPPGNETSSLYVNLSLRKITTKQLYQILIFKIKEIPVSIDKWVNESILTVENWKNCFCNLYFLTYDYKIRQHQYKILHKVDNTGHNLKNWKIQENNICKHCSLAEENLLHKYILCGKNNNIFESVNLWLNDILGQQITYTETEFLTGRPKKLDHNEIIYERVFLELKYFIHKKKTATLMKDKLLFINCLDFILELLGRIKIEKELRSMAYIKRIWGDISKLV
jgi:hypothetical protein